MLKISVCDDEPAVLEHIRLYLDRICKELHKKAEVFYFPDGESLVQDMPRDTQILLLDIRMKTLSGMDAARALRDEGLGFFLFFITNNVEYALEGYEVHAYGFLRKPLVYSHLKRLLSEVIRKIERSRPQIITVKGPDGMRPLNCQDILYFEVFGHEIKVVMKTETMNSSVPLSELEKQLKEHGFFRCHKSYLINLHLIAYIGTRDVLLSNGHKVPLSKYKKKMLIDEYSRLMGEIL